MSDMSQMLNETLATARVINISISDLHAKTKQLREALVVALPYVQACQHRSVEEFAADLALIEAALEPRPAS